MMTPASRLISITATATLLGVGLTAQTSTGQEVSAADLQELVRAYVTAEKTQDAETIENRIERAAKGVARRVADALRRVQVWKSVSPQRGALRFTSGGRRSIGVSFRVPASYDPRLPHAALVCFPSSRTGADARLAFVRRLFGASIDGFVLVALDRPIGGSFHQSPDAAGDLDRLMVELRRRFHLDTNRVYLFGADEGADAAWTVAMTRPDLFAGLVALSGYPRLPYADVTTDFLIENLRTLRVAFFYSTPLVDPTARQGAIERFGRWVESKADAASLPITTAELSEDPKQGHAGRTAWSDVFGHVRASTSGDVSLWFRYPEQGRFDWLRVLRFEGDVWTESQLSILPASRTDRAGFIAGVIKRKLGFIAGRVDGQTIDVSTRRCAKIEIVFRPGLVNLDKPVLIRCNGKKRFTGLIQPDVSTLLQEARATWDFQRLAYARRSIKIKAIGRGRRTRD